ncbi:hypothetical protein ANN_24796 [Periplaneta americana]|uniref:PiggyBac transposable element-derived protein domain-containing protein n=1 Tax=Periplaneta americana TaxID=6978 RepID=A0ABQ8RZY6_PERAM|nr:hypothetical protein ANN_24796 [Periplaneta americana]
MSRKATEELLEESTDSETEIENDDDDDDDGEVVSEPEDQCIMRDEVDGDEVESSSEDDPDNLSEIEISDKYANRKHIPQELKEVSGRELYSSKFAFSDPNTGSVPITIVSYIPREKSKRNLLILSTQHYDDAIGAPSDTKKKTVINLYYNDTKGGVDTMDQMVRKYSTKRTTRRWPVSIFYTLLDIAALNGYTIFILNFPDWNKKKPNQRRLYLQELGLKLITPYIEKLARNVTGLQKCVISAMEGILKRKIKQTSGAKEVHGGKGRCHLCTRDCRSKIDKYNKVSKTTIICSVCKRYTCGKHSKKSVVCSICEDGCEESDVKHFTIYFVTVTLKYLLEHIQ